MNKVLVCLVLPLILLAVVTSLVLGALELTLRVVAGDKIDMWRDYVTEET